MAVTKNKDTKTHKKVRPASTPEDRELQCIAAASELALQQLMDGTASSQVIVHYLKLGTEKAKLEVENLKAQNELLTEKAENVRSDRKSEKLYEEALIAFATYRGDD